MGKLKFLLKTQKFSFRTFQSPEQLQIIKDSLSYDVKHRPNNGKVLFERFLYATERQFL